MYFVLQMMLGRSSPSGVVLVLPPVVLHAYCVVLALVSEKYFDMSKKNCREGFGVYKKFLVRMDKVAEFLKVAEVSGIGSGHRSHCQEG